MSDRRPLSNITPDLSRRSFFNHAGEGLLGTALATLLSDDLSAAGTEKEPGYRSIYDLKPQQPHFEPSAKAVIQLFMQGGPSQVDLFDPKPALKKYHGKTTPKEFTEGAFARDRVGVLMDSSFKFAQHGKTGAWISDALPHMAKEADQLSFIHSMFNVHSNHEPAIYKMQSGQIFPGHPTFGSWVVYGLGSENQNLPSFVVLADPVNKLPTNAVENWQAGFLPPLYQGTPMRPTGSPVLNLQPDYQEPAAVTAAKRNLLASLDNIHKKTRPRYNELDARINNYQLAARMQLEAAQALDVSGETKATLEMYGIGEKKTDSFGRRCLLARRLIERGVRFIQILPKGQSWDNHGNIRASLPAACGAVDKPTAGLLKDLRQRGLLDSTLVLWGGEFGRLPMAQVKSIAQIAKAGRDHGPYGFTTVMAGGGVKPGVRYGETDEVGYGSVINRVSIQDWHATILHPLGINHKKLIYPRNGLMEKLTHVFEAKVVKEIVA